MRVDRKSAAGTAGGGARWLRRAAFAAALLLQGSAQALTVADTKPIYFPTSGSGFTLAAVTAAGLPISFTSTPADTFLTVANPSAFPNPALSVTQTLTNVYQNPQQNGQTPTTANPFIADSRWTIRNDSGGALPGALLVFTNVNYTGYPTIPVGLDANTLVRLQHTAGGVDYQFGGIYLGPMGAGAQVDVVVRYIVGGAMPLAGSTLTMPPLQARALVVVPEPGTLVLVVLGIGSIAALRRRS